MPSPKLLALALLWPHPAASGQAATGVELENELVEVEIKPLAKPRAVALPDRVAQDPAHFSLVFENDKVRVLRFRLGPRERGPSHSDAPHVSS